MRRRRRTTRKERNNSYPASDGYSLSWKLGAEGHITTRNERGARVSMEVGSAASPITKENVQDELDEFRTVHG